MILFDFDGVISDSKEVCLAACRAAAREQVGTITIGADVFETLDPLTFEALADNLGLRPDAFAAAVAEYVSTNAAGCAPFDGIPEMISDIARCHDLAVISASHSQVIRSFLQRHGLIDHFAYVIGGDTPGNKTQKIAALIEQAGGTSHVFVGDAVSDMQAGRAAGLPVIAVTWGWQPRARLETEQPDHFAASPAGLRDLLLTFDPPTDSSKP